MIKIGRLIFGSREPASSTVVVDGKDAVPNCPEHGGKFVLVDGIRIGRDGLQSANVRCGLCDWSWSKGAADKDAQQ